MFILLRYFPSVLPFPIPLSSYPDPPPWSTLLTFHREPRYTVVFCGKCKSSVTDKRNGNKYVMECSRLSSFQRHELVKYTQTLEPLLLFHRDLFVPRSNGSKLLSFLPPPKPGFVCLQPGCTFVTTSRALSDRHYIFQYELTHGVRFNTIPQADQKAWKLTGYHRTLSPVYTQAHKLDEALTDVLITMLKEPATYSVPYELLSHPLLCMPDGSRYKDW